MSARAGRVELRHEAVRPERRPGLGRLERAGRDRESREILAAAGHVDVAGGVERDVVDVLLAVAAEIGGVGEDGIDRERSRAIVGAELEAHLARAEADIAAGDVPAHAIDHLIAHRRVLAQRRVRRPRGPADRRRDRSRARAAPSKRMRIADGSAPGRDQEVVLQASLVAVELEVDAVVDAGVTDAGELTDADLPARRDRRRCSG